MLSSMGAQMNLSHCPITRILGSMMAAPCMFIQKRQSIISNKHPDMVCKFFGHLCPELPTQLYNHNNALMYILIYMDDILLTGTDTTTISKMLHNLHQQFHMHNLRPISHFLGTHFALRSPAFTSIRLDTHNNS